MIEITTQTIIGVFAVAIAGIFGSFLCDTIDKKVN